MPLIKKSKKGSGLIKGKYKVRLEPADDDNGAHLAAEVK